MNDELLITDTVKTKTMYMVVKKSKHTDCIFLDSNQLYHTQDEAFSARKNKIDFAIKHNIKTHSALFGIVPLQVILKKE